MQNKEIIERLNDLLSREHACTIRYGTHAAVIEGPYAETVKTRLNEIAGDESRHAAILRDRIFAMGEKPQMKVRDQDLKPAEKLDEILDINIQEEKEAIRDYEEILKQVPVSNAILFQAIQNIIKDEQEHLEELEALRPGAQEASSKK